MDTNTVLLLLILAVLLFGSSAVLGALQAAVWISIAIGVVVFIFWAFVKGVDGLIRALGWLFDRRWMGWLWYLFFPKPQEGQTRGQKLAEDLISRLLALAYLGAMIFAFAGIMVWLGLYPPKR